LLNPGFDHCDSAFNGLLHAAARTGAPEMGQILPLLRASVPGAVKLGAASQASDLIEMALPV
jgi:hypothetical protein